MSIQPLTSAVEIPAEWGRTTSIMTDSAKDFGDVIDLGTVSKSRRGAVATYKPGLLSLLGERTQGRQGCCGDGYGGSAFGLLVGRRLP